MLSRTAKIVMEKLIRFEWDLEFKRFVNSNSDEYDRVFLGIGITRRLDVEGCHNHGRNLHVTILLIQSHVTHTAYKLWTYTKTKLKKQVTPISIRLEVTISSPNYLNFAPRVLLARFNLLRIPNL